MAKKTKETTPRIDLTGYYDNPELGAIQQQPSAGPQQYGDMIYGQPVVPNPISAEFAQIKPYDERTPQRTLMDELQARPPATLTSDDRTKGQLRRDRLAAGYRRNVPESFRTLLPGFSDVEDALYLRESLQSGNAGQIGLAAAGFALPFVGSKVLKGAAKKLGKKAGRRGREELTEQFEPQFLEQGERRVWEVPPLDPELTSAPDITLDDVLPFEGGEIVEPRAISRTERKITRQAERQAAKRKNYNEGFANKPQKQSEFSKVMSGKRDGNFAVSELGEDFNVRKAYLDPLDKKAGTDITIYRSGGKGETTGGETDTILGFKLAEDKKGTPVVSDMIFTREQNRQGILDAGRMAQMFVDSTPKGAIFKPGSLSTDSFPLYLNTLIKRNKKTPGQYVIQAEEVTEWFTPNNLGKYTDEIYETPTKQVDFLNSKVDEFNATVPEGGNKVPPVKLNKQGRVVIPDIVVKKMLPAMLGIGMFGASKEIRGGDQDQTGEQFESGGQLMSKSKINIKPSKRGTFTAAATKHGKTVQGFASQVMRNPDNYTPAMVKKANFARNAAKWKKELGGYLDQELNNPIIEDTPIDSAVVPKTQFGCGGKLRQHQDGGQIAFNPPIMVPLKSGQIGDIQGGGAEGGGIGSIGEGLEGGEFPEFPNTTTYGGSEFGPEPSLQGLLSQNPGLEETVPETTLPVPEFRNGGRLPDYGVGGWLGTAGSIASIIPVVGQIAGPILKTAGAVAGKFEEKAAAEKALRTQKAEAQFQAAQEAEGLEGEEAPQYQFGGNLTQGQGNFKNPVINEYNGNANTHQQGPGGIPVDAKGTPSAVSRQSAVGLTEKGEVSWNGYVFSDKLNV